MKLCIFGGSRGVGKECILQALEQGHSVTALLRTPSKLDDIPQDKRSQLTIVQGDVLKAEDVEKAAQGAQVIITSLGGDASVCSKGTPFITQAQKKYNIDRNIVVTSCGVGDSWNDFSLIMKPLLYMFLGRVLADKDIQEQQLKQSGVNYIIVRPPRLMDGPKMTNYQVGLHLKPTWIYRSDVADFILKQLTSTEWLNKTPTVTNSV